MNYIGYKSRCFFSLNFFRDLLFMHFFQALKQNFRPLASSSCITAIMVSFPEDFLVDSLKLGKIMGNLPGLVNVYSLRTWKWPSRNSEFSHEKWWFSIVVCIFTRGKWTKWWMFCQISQPESIAYHHIPPFQLHRGWKTMGGAVKIWPFDQSHHLSRDPSPKQPIKKNMPSFVGTKYFSMVSCYG